MPFDAHHRRLDPAPHAADARPPDVRFAAPLDGEDGGGGSPRRLHRRGARRRGRSARARLCVVGTGGRADSNDEVASLVAAHPSLFTGVASVDLLRPMDAVRELRRAVRTLGLKALRILPWLYGLPPNDRRYYPLYAECIELGIPFCLQVGHTGPLRASEPGRPIPYLDEVALDFPELTIVAGHIGYPWTLEMIALATKYPNVYIDTSAWKPSRFPADLTSYLRGHGRRKVLFGSNYPMILPADCVKEVSSLELDEEATKLFLSGNAARVFGLLA
ncbi:MAG: amidohydrolase family protein [Minicystis sp.]